MSKIKGVALLWSLIISTILLIISGTMVSYIVKDSQSSVRIEDSVKAYAAAKSGVDWAKNLIAKDSTYTPTTNCLVPDTFNFTFNNIATKVTICSSSTIKVVSLASVNQVRRKLEYNFTNQTVLGITPPNSSGNIECLNCGFSDNSGNFTFEFTFWQQDTAGGEIGFESATGLSADYITVKFDPTGIKLRAKTATTSLSESTISHGAYTKYQFFKGKLEYKKNIGAYLTVSEVDFNEGLTQDSPIPVGSISVPTTGTSFANLKYFYASNAVYPSSDPAVAQSFLLTRNAGATTGSAISNLKIIGAAAPIPTYTVSAGVYPNGYGGVGNVTGTGTYLKGSNVSLTAVPNDPTKWAFDYWSGDCSGTSSTYTINGITSNKSCLANFKEIAPPPTCTLTATKVGGQRIRVSWTSALADAGTIRLASGETYDIPANLLLIGLYEFTMGGTSPATMTVTGASGSGSCTDTF